MTRATFVLDGRRFDLDSDIVVALISGAEPEPIREHAVRIDERWYPVRQAFEMASGVPRSEFTSHTARRHLSTLGFELHGEITHREGTTREHPPREAPSTASVRRTRPTSIENEWPSEASVQALVVAALVAEGWSIESVANTATKERGIDIIALRGGHRIGIEVKGFPSKKYADPRRAGERKKTQPSTQAGHWYAEAVLAAMRLRSKQPAWQSIIALPDFRRYRDIHRETSGSLDAARIDVWWVASDGKVTGLESAG